MRLCLWMPAPIFSAFGALFITLIYCLLAGFSLATKRAFIMAAVATFMICTKRNVSPWHGYWLALLMVLIVNPLSPLNAGFWLSFGAVGILLYAFNSRSHVGKKWLQAIKAQLVVMLGLLPLGLSLMILIASSKLFLLSRTATGPKTSSSYNVIPGCAFSNKVGPRKYPFSYP